MDKLGRQFALQVFIPVVAARDDPDVDRVAFVT